MLTFSCQECTMTALHLKSNNTKWYTCLKPWAHNAVGKKVQNIYKNKKKKQTFTITSFMFSHLRWRDGAHHGAQHLVTGEADFTNTVTKNQLHWSWTISRGVPWCCPHHRNVSRLPQKPAKTTPDRRLSGWWEKALLEEKKTQLRETVGQLLLFSWVSVFSFKGRRANRPVTVRL